MAEEEAEWRGTIPPRRPWEQAALEREADAILSAAHERLRKSGAVKDNEGRRVWSLDAGFEEAVAPDVILGGTTVEHDEVDDLVASLEGILTPSERQIVQAIAEGSPSPGADDRAVWTEAIATLTGKTQNTVRVTWSNAKKKLINEWANEPEERERTVIHSSKEGNGHTLVIGSDPGWRPRRVDPQEAAEALRKHGENSFRNSDWNYERSLTEDGWQLGDDEFWSGVRLS